ncbi:hypothetical protein GCM10022244_50210 [Streptomyces gulbargensis]|uniref:Uncharacterized protein n=1 Tax=Streptomyces gulbargensis TaxID=364901 RepID=A0ABP7N362_9ACTN
MPGTTRDSIHPWQFGLVVLAALTPLPPLAVAAAEGFVDLPLAILTSVVTGLPLLLHARPAGFAVLIGCVAPVLLFWSFAGAMAGMFVFLPSVLQLLLALGADPRRGPVPAKVMAAGGLLLSVAVPAHFLT